MHRRWSFPPSRMLDALLVVFAINGVLVGTSIVARYASADDPVPQEANVAQDSVTDSIEDKVSETSQAPAEVSDVEGSNQPATALVAPSPASDPAAHPLPSDVPPAPQMAPAGEELLESLKQDEQFQQFVEIAAEQFPEYLQTTPPNASSSLQAASDVASAGETERVGSDKLRELEERLLVVSELNQAALRLARIAHRQAAADRPEESRQSLQLSQQLQEISAGLLQKP